MTTPVHCDFSPHDFTAIAIRTSDGRLVQVTGSGLCPTPGWDLRLTAGAPGFRPGLRPQPGRLRLELRELPPSRAPRVRTETTVDVTIEDTRAEEVEIRFGWREGFVIPVREAVPLHGLRGAMRRQVDAASDRVATSAV